VRSPTGSSLVGARLSHNDENMMVKVIVACRRKSGISLEQFNDHWHTQHARLVTRFVDALNVVRYVQSYRGGNEAIARI
jgi:hypothetical protein